MTVPGRADQREGPERWTIFVCPTCGYWTPARLGADSFFTCDGAGRLIEDERGFYRAAGVADLHAPTVCARVEVREVEAERDWATARLEALRELLDREGAPTHDDAGRKLNVVGRADDLIAELRERLAALEGQTSS